MTDILASHGITSIIIGWLGVLLCTTAYMMLSIKLLSPDRALFQILNILGGSCLVFTAMSSSDTPNIVVNLLWVFIGLYALGKNLGRKSQDRDI